MPPTIAIASEAPTLTEVVKIAFKGWNASSGDELTTPTEAAFIRFSGQPVRGVFDVTTPTEAVNIAFKGWNASVADTTTPSDAVVVFPYKQVSGVRTSVSLSIRM